MKTNFICKAFLLTAALFSTSFAKHVVEENYVVEKNEFSNTATFIGGPVDIGIDDKLNKCEVNTDDIKQYAVVSKTVFEIENICKENYVVALALDQEDDSEFKMIKARVIESSENCNDAQVILNKETYDKISKSDEMANIIWAIVDNEGNVKLEVNYEAFKKLDEEIGIPANVIQGMFEQSAKDMVINNIDAKGYPWDVTDNDNGNGFVGTAAIVAAAAGLICFTSYKVKSKKIEKNENSLAIPELPPHNTTINTISDHPDGLPRVNIYNPPLEYYHFPMDTTYDIVDIRPDLSD